MESNCRLAMIKETVRSEGALAPSLPYSISQKKEINGKREGTKTAPPATTPEKAS